MLVKESAMTWAGEDCTADASSLGIPPGAAPSSLDVAPDEGEPESFVRVGEPDRDREGEVICWRYVSRESRRTLVVWND